MSEYEPTNHAVIRARQRVGLKGEGEDLKRYTRNWLKQVIPNSQYLGRGDDGHKHYRHKEFKIVVTDKNIVVTISYYNPKGRGLSIEVTEMIRRKINKEVKPLKNKLRLVSIEMHKAEIKKLKSYNPKSLATIEKEIEFLRDEVARCKVEISDIEDLARRYGMTI